MDIDWGSIIETVVNKIVVPKIATYVEQQQAQGVIVTEAAIHAELDQNGTMQEAKDAAWLLAHPHEAPPA